MIALEQDPSFIFHVIVGCLATVSTALLAVLGFLFNRGLNKFDALEERMNASSSEQTEVLQVLTANQEQIKTLFKNQDDHREEIRELESRLNRRDENDRFLPPPTAPHRRRH